MTVERGHFRKLFDLSGRVAVVTGAVGLLGRHFCAGLADHGASVAVVDLDERQTSALAKEIERDFGVKAMGIAADISDPVAVKAMAEKIEKQLGPIDILHSNAQAVRRNPERYFEPAESFDLETWREIMSVNLDGMFNVAQVFGGRMAERGYGAIVQLSLIHI